MFAAYFSKGRYVRTDNTTGDEQRLSDGESKALGD
jgi:hypothetical protein